MVTLSELVAHLPPEPDETTLFAEIQQAVTSSKRKLVVIDDDPTGTQTVHDIELFMTWNESLLTEALRDERQLFYILTNSRSMPEQQAVEVNREIARQLDTASRNSGVDFAIASRSDSTLRGHYPAEILALESEFATAQQTTIDGHLIVPAFFEGGRYTINDTHYLAVPTPTSDTLQAAHETPFASDKVFGYTTAYLPDWVEEKSAGRWKADQVVSISLELIREGGVAAVAARLQEVTGGTPVVINAAGYGDLAVVILGLLRAESAGKRFLYRTAASFVRLRGALENRPLLTADEILLDNTGAATSSNGGLVIVGSYVPSSSAQLENLLAVPDVIGIELPVDRVLASTASAHEVSRETGQQLEQAVQNGQIGVLYSSRKLITSANQLENLDIGRRVSDALIAALHEVQSQPRFIIAKGGITSHDVAQKGLGAARAHVAGQLFPGIPVWRLQAGPQARFENVPYVGVPGNVGTPESLAQAVTLLRKKGNNDAG
jgi:uncharacterized protein YgbK (DUF1537 family)